MMAETLVGVSPTEPQMQDPQEPGLDAVADSEDATSPDEPAQPVAPVSGRAASKQDLAALQRLVRQAQEDGVALTGPDGLLKMLTKTVIEVALDEEMSSHLGYDKHAVEGRGSGNERNGVRSKTVITQIGPVPRNVDRDRPDLREHRLRSGAVPLVPAPVDRRRLRVPIRVLVAEVLGQLFLQSGLQHLLGQARQHTVGADQVDSFSAGLVHQTLRQRLPVVIVEVHDPNRVRHAACSPAEHRSARQAEPPPTVVLTLPRVTSIICRVQRVVDAGLARWRVGACVAGGLGCLCTTCRGSRCESGAVAPL